MGQTIVPTKACAFFLISIFWIGIQRIQPNYNKRCYNYSREI
ncbi:hypothetical protein THERMOS_941 [Bathymodiolus thermophilus thioautotrophic gill symbiont]|uniref:Uncharacterized protein n=1 Tax=Bathymodiolus thermophilus thioautotrophic gill symbiont TaxID=2360 RepID=A0A8H9CFH5_9GAMM|nr:hypothetical protein THERMOS_941 [Bathymodiolus thermophilus thioautotrophic gill symbiont]